jgi:uncharacterized protein YdbL (DUF1318 family)
LKSFQEEIMMILMRNISFYALIVSIVISCVTINIYFPAAAVEKAADEIVEEVWGEEKKKTDEKENEPESYYDRLRRFGAIKLSVQEAFAQEADINVTTPSIRALKDSIRKRAESLKLYLNTGNVGISNDGLLVLRSTAALQRQDKANLVRLINAENEDREALYLEIAKANDFGPDKVPEIKKIFASSWIKNAQRGWFIQGPDGEWSRKE